MSCARCLLHRGNLPTDAAFTDVQRRLAARVEAGDLMREEGPPVRLARDDRPLLTEYYQCRHCDAVWRLTAPRRYDPTPTATFEHTSPGALTEMLRAGSSSGVPVVREPISMFADSVTLPSPDGHHTATMTDAEEFQMGSPTHGTLTISNGIVRENCSPTMVWSDDSEYLAVSEIVDRAHPARVLIFSMSRRDARYAPGHYYGLEFHSFSGGTVRATDGENAVDIDVSGIDWSAPPSPEAPPSVPASGLPEPRGESARTAAVSARARDVSLGGVRVPASWTFVDDELRLTAAPPSSFDGAIVAVGALSATLLFWLLVFISNAAGLATQSPWLFGGLAVASLLAVGWAAFRGGRWRVVLDRAAGSVCAVRGRRVVGPVRFAPEMLKVRPFRARPRAFVVLRVAGAELVLAAQPATDATALRDGTIEWMARRLEPAREGNE